MGHCLSSAITLPTRLKSKYFDGSSSKFVANNTPLIFAAALLLDAYNYCATTAATCSFAPLGTATS